MTPIFATILSLILFGTWTVTRQKASTLSRIIQLALSIVYISYVLLYFISNQFTGQGITEAVIYHLDPSLLTGAGYTAHYRLIISSILILSLFPLISLFFSKFAEKFHQPKILRSFSILFLIGSFYTAPTTENLITLYKNNIRTADISTNTGDFRDFFRSPTLQRTSAQPKNLIFVYMESLERTYFDNKLFPGLIKHLRKLEKQGVSFSNIEDNWRTQWTIAGMVASQCGMPLTGVPEYKNTATGLDRFLSKATCIGDLLARQGYRLTFLTGEDPRFGGTEAFYRSHGFAHIIGLHDLLPRMQNPNYQQPGWGLYDDTLFKQAFEEYQSLAHSDRPFALFLPTMDTHFEAFISKTCREKGIAYKRTENKMLDSVACADYLISHFVEQILKSRHGGNTVIVLESDHLAMRNDATDILNKGKRRNTFIIISRNLKPSLYSRPGNKFDVGPTVLSVLGFKATLGLGRNLFAERSLTETEGSTQLDALLKKWHPTFKSYWDFPNISPGDSIIVSSDRKIIFSGRHLEFPLLASVSTNGNTDIHLATNTEEYFGLLIRNYNSLSPGQRFIWVDFCKNMNRNGAFCIRSGKKGQEEQTRRLTWEDRRYVFSNDLTPILSDSYYWHLVMKARALSRKYLPPWLTSYF